MKVASFNKHKESWVDDPKWTHFDKNMFEIEWIKFLQCAPPPSLILKALRKREKWEKLTPEIPFLASFKIKKVYFCQCCPHAHKNSVSKETPTTVKVPGHNGAKIFMYLHFIFFNQTRLLTLILWRQSDIRTHSIKLSLSTQFKL